MKKSGASSTLPNSCQDQQQINQHVFTEHLQAPMTCAYVNGSQPWLRINIRTPRPDMNIFKWQMMQDKFDALAFWHYGI